LDVNWASNADFTQTFKIEVWFVVLTSVVMKSSAFWDTTSCRSVERKPAFLRQARNQRGGANKQTDDIYTPAPQVRMCEVHVSILGILYTVFAWLTNYDETASYSLPVSQKVQFPKLHGWLWRRFGSNGFYHKFYCMHLFLSLLFRCNVYFILFNPILFAICTSTFRKLCKWHIQWHVEECSVALLCN
jgi:hypothetical protein